MRRAIVDLFGAEGLTDVRALRRVYAQLIKVHRPETGPSERQQQLPGFSTP